MTIPLKPDHLEAAYDCLRRMPPFDAWAGKLPEGELVEFRVTRSRDHFGWHQSFKKSHHLIAISSTNVGHLSTLMHVMGHEMIHLYQSEFGHETKGAMHNADFQRRQRQLCKVHGFDFGILR